MVSLNTPQLLVLALRHIGRIGAPLHSGFGMEKLVLLFFLQGIIICKLPGGAVLLVQATHLRKVLLVNPVAYSRAAGRICHQKSRAVRNALLTMLQLWSGSCLSGNLHLAWHCNR